MEVYLGVVVLKIIIFCFGILVKSLRKRAPPLLLDLGARHKPQSLNAYQLAVYLLLITPVLTVFEVGIAEIGALVVEVLFVGRDGVGAGTGLGGEVLGVSNEAVVG